MRLAGSRGEFPYDEGKHLIVIVEEFFYGDDAGTHSTAAYCLVGGYRASPRQWKKFRKEWQEALDDAGVAEFHANVFFNRTVNKNPQENPYLKWSEAKATAFRRCLLDIIHKRDIRPFRLCRQRSRFQGTHIWRAVCGLRPGHSQRSAVALALSVCACCHADGGP